MNDVSCPYCGTEQEICHDDGYGYSEEQEHEQACTSCDKTFEFTTSISFHYEVFCLSKEDHDIEQGFPDKSPDYWTCTKCDYHEFRREKTQ